MFLVIAVVVSGRLVSADMLYGNETSSGSVHNGGGTPLREVTGRHSGAIDFTYDFIGPVKSADIKFYYSPQLDIWDRGVVTFGNGKSVDLPSGVVHCLTDLHPELMDMLSVAVDAKYPMPNDYWWSSVIMPFSQKMRAHGVQDPMVAFRLYPYVEFEISRWVLSRVDIWRSPTESRSIPISSQTCPTKDIFWATQGR